MDPSDCHDIIDQNRSYSIRLQSKTHNQSRRASTILQSLFDMIASKFCLFLIALLTCEVSCFQVHHPLFKSRAHPSQSIPQNQFTLFSLRPFVDEIISSDKQRIVFCGGKGGVGKTTVSAALAIHLAQQDLKVLIVSTDPAHSLGDALDEDLRKGRGEPIVMTDPLTGGRLSAAEIDAQSALQDFRENLSSFDVERMASSLGVSADLLESLGLREFSGLLNNPPPGLDELVALGNVMDYKSETYDVIVVDTAPTGHTLRLLALPQFLDGVLGKLIKLRMKLAGLTSTLQGLLGDTGAKERVKTLDNAMKKLEAFKTKMMEVEGRLRDNGTTNFLVVTVPTTLAVKESERLVLDLRKKGIAVSDVVVNQCIGETGGTCGEYGSRVRRLLVALTFGKPKEIANETRSNYYKRRRAGQQKWINALNEAIEEVGKSPEFKANGDPAPISLTSLPFFDVELTGVPALGFVGAQYFASNPSFQHLMTKIGEQPKVVICGGKGGVGKTTTSSSLAVSLAAKGLKVALISTDPAHSLGDAIDMNLEGGNMIDCPLLGVSSTGDGSLSVMEIDPSSAISEFKSTVDQFLGAGSLDSPGGGSDVRSTMNEIENIFDTLPAGTDEVVALAKVVNFIKKGSYDCIILDTAPTGHTLRMLSTPGFVADLIDRLLTISRKINSNVAVKMLIAGATSGDTDQLEAAGTAAKSQLISFQLGMYDLEDLFSNADQTEFLIITVPTELAVRESVRLLNDLTFEAPEMPLKRESINGYTKTRTKLAINPSDQSTILGHRAKRNVKPAVPVSYCPPRYKAL
eukprot:scaffold1993_cov107-Cylindrotheca_fusiformis.AAC.4